MKNIASILCLISVFSLAPLVHAEEAANTDVKGSAPVEKRISDLHSKLKITAEQEDLWKSVAQEMRDTGKTFNEATRDREKKAKTMSAVDDLNSYAELASMHAASMKKFVDVFTPLYAAMSDSQKKNADNIFREHKEGKKKGGA